MKNEVVTPKASINRKTYLSIKITVLHEDRFARWSVAVQYVDAFVAEKVKLLSVDYSVFTLMYCKSLLLLLPRRWMESCWWFKRSRNLNKSISNRVKYKQRIYKCAFTDVPTIKYKLFTIIQESIRGTLLWWKKVNSIIVKWTKVHTVWHLIYCLIHGLHWKARSTQESFYCCRQNIIVYLTDSDARCYLSWLIMDGWIAK